MNPRTGIVRRLGWLRPEPGDPPIHVVGSELGDSAALGAAGPVQATGAAGFTRREAAAAAVGEACERYAAAFVDHERLNQASAADLPGAVTDWALFAPHQHDVPEMPFHPWSDTRVMHWVQAEPVVPTGDAAWVPAQFVYMPFPGEREPLAPSMSTGLAAGPSYAHATLSALLEIIERDAFTLTWLTNAAPPAVPRDVWPEPVTRMARFGTLRMFDITSDVGIPSALAVLEKPSDVGLVRVIGAATRHDADAAMTKAALEAFQTVPYVRHLVRAEPDWRAGPRFENLRDFRDHARFYAVHPEHAAGLQRFLRPERSTAMTRSPVPSSPREALDDAAARMAHIGLDAYVVDLTTPDLAEAGVHVVRALCPTAQPLHGFYQVPHLGGPRLVAASRHLPFLDDDVPIAEVNRWPHPFA